MNILHICPPRQSDIATLPWEIQNGHVFRSIIDTYFILFTLSQKKTNSPITMSGECYRRSGCMKYQSVIQTSCTYGWLRHWLNFSTVWHTMRLISGKKDWKHCVSIQNVATLNTCCDVAYLTFQLPHITTGSFQSHQCHATTGSSQPPTFEGFSQMKKFCILQLNVVTF